MNNTKFIEIESFGITQIHAVIEHEDGSTTSMLKSAYDELKPNEATAV